MDNKAKILIVDDNSTNLKLLRNGLGQKYDVQEALNGQLALEISKQFYPDIILLDVMMPGIDGLEVCRRLRKDERLKYVKILLLTSNIKLEQRLEGYKAGADDYIGKPFDFKELLAKIEVFKRLKNSEEVNDIKSNFLDILSHATGTPLSVIMAYSSILTSSPNLAEEEKNMVEQIKIEK